MIIWEEMSRRDCRPLVNVFRKLKGLPTVWITGMAARSNAILCPTLLE